MSRLKEIMTGDVLNTGRIEAYNALLEACKEALDSLVIVLQLDKEGKDPDGFDYTVWLNLKDAIAKAGG